MTCGLSAAAAVLGAIGWSCSIEAAGISTQSAPAAASAAPSGDLTDLRLEDLMNIEVTSAGRKEQRLYDIASAVYVITQEDIARSGVTSIPELLRMVPGLEVAQITANIWAISARGFNTRFANKLLVMIDGRSVYTPLFAGVYWNVQDLALDDIERIEIIRGPGASVWGANAVNGVIDIITKPSGETAGGFLRAVAGSEDRVLGVLGWGGRFGEKGSYRVYGKYFDRAGYVDATGEPASDGWHASRGGFRSDFERGASDTFTFQGDAYDGRTGESVKTSLLTAPYVRIVQDDGKIEGGNLLGRWQHRFTAGSDLTIQVYHDRTGRFLKPLRETRNTSDFDLQHHIRTPKRHDIVWGLTYRSTSDETIGSFTVSFEGERRRDWLAGAFLQDEIAFFQDRVRVTLGSKLEYNNHTGVEIQPNLRFLWRASERQVWWAAISRATRSPSRAEDDVVINSKAGPGPFGLTFLARLSGNPELLSEELIAYEAGWRMEAGHDLSLDVAAFYNEYENLIAIVPGTPFLELSPAPAHVVAPYHFENAWRARSRGVEISSVWKVTSRWTLTGWYTWFDLDLIGVGSPAISDSLSEGVDPRNQAHLRSHLELPRRFDLDIALHYVSRLADSDVPDYLRADLRVAWRLNDTLEFSAGGRNLLDSRHRESGPDTFALSSEVPRSVYGGIKWNF